MSRDPARPGDDAGGEEGFVQRWSRRKSEAREVEPSAPQVPSPPPAAEPEPVLTDADMPPVESLDDKSDYGMFLSPGVSEELRRLALRKLFRLPEFNQRFELDGEYYDCTNLEPLGSIITYDMREEMRRAAEKLAETMTEETAQAGAPSSAPASAASAPERPASAPADASAGGARDRKPARRRRSQSRTKA
jgi:hypothetical protein